MVRIKETLNMSPTVTSSQSLQLWKVFVCYSSSSFSNRRLGIRYVSDVKMSKEQLDALQTKMELDG